ncbi:hypothetical protein Taro_053938 [Colocasia esculenta]|uniref:CASP-like protein n=1 Tax=Colocasia esculenta TaxID=4460 RepID=A0A843XM94_COLES|nr:hypothetical protein [Colocasia esculenta]
MAFTAGDGKAEADPATTAAATAVPPVAEVRSADVENPPSDTAVASAVERWRREDLLDKAALVLRGLGCLFSALAFVVMASNSHGDWQEFDKYEEYRYLVAISSLAFLYAGAQVVRRALILAGRRDVLSRRAGTTADFAGDQIII